MQEQRVPQAHAALAVMYSYGLLVYMVPPVH